jgi:RNA polymerase sigma-54 factor
MYQNIKQKTDTRTTISIHLAKTMEMLSMSADEVREQVESELSINPALERIDERICPTCKRPLPQQGICQFCGVPKSDSDHENIVFVSPREDFYSGKYSSYSNSYMDEPDVDSAQKKDLPTYVLRQIGPDLLEDQKKIAAYLLTGLDEDGFLTTSVHEIANYYHVLPSKIEEVIKLIQHADPAGVGSRNPQEALLVQIQHLSSIVNIPSGTKELVEESYDLLMHGKYREISKKHALSVKQVQNIEKFIRENLNPFPGRAFWGENIFPDDRDLDTFHQPDILIYYLNDDPKNQLVVEIIMPITGFLQVNPIFKTELRNAPELKAEEWKNDIERASLLVKCINQRNNTMVRLMQILVTLQSDYIRHGDMSIKPITRAQVAKELDVHESTISRAVSNKTVMLPNKKVIPLASFFDRSLNVRTIIKDLVKEEKKPLTDAKIVDILSGMGFDIARRTVAKYRAMEGILPAHMRNVINMR